MAKTTIKMELFVNIFWKLNSLGDGKILKINKSGTKLLKPHVGMGLTGIILSAKLEMLKLNQII